MFYTKNSLLTVTYDTYMKHNNECKLYNKTMLLDKGIPFVIDSDLYCEVFVKVELKLSDIQNN